MESGISVFIAHPHWFERGGKITGIALRRSRIPPPRLNSPRYHSPKCPELLTRTFAFPHTLQTLPWECPDFTWLKAAVEGKTRCHQLLFPGIWISRCVLILFHSWGVKKMAISGLRRWVPLICKATNWCSYTLCRLNKQDCRGAGRQTLLLAACICLQIHTVKTKQIQEWYQSSHLNLQNTFHFILKICFKGQNFIFSVHKLWISGLEVNSVASNSVFCHNVFCVMYLSLSVSGHWHRQSSVMNMAQFPPETTHMHLMSSPGFPWIPDDWAQRY